MLDDFYATRALLPRVRPVLVPTDIEIASCMRVTGREQQSPPDSISSGDWKRAAEWCGVRCCFMPLKSTTMEQWDSYAEWALSRGNAHIVPEVKLPMIHKCYADLQWASERDVPWRAMAISQAHKRWRRLGKKLRTKRWVGQLAFDMELRLPRRLSIEHTSWNRDVVRAWAGRTSTRHTSATANTISHISTAPHISTATTFTSVSHVTASSFGLNPKPDRLHVEAAARAVARLRETVNAEQRVDSIAAPRSQDLKERASMFANSKPHERGLSKLDQQILARRRLATIEARAAWQRMALKAARNPEIWVGQSLFEQELKRWKCRRVKPLLTGQQWHEEVNEDDLDIAILHAIRSVDKLGVHQVSPVDTTPAAAHGLSPPSDAEREAASRAVAHIRYCISK